MDGKAMMKWVNWREEVCVIKDNGESAQWCSRVGTTWFLWKMGALIYKWFRSKGCENDEDWGIFVWSNLLLKW